MFNEQAAIYLHTGQSHRLWNGERFLFRIIIAFFLVCFYKVLRVFLKEWRQTPTGTVPWLHRAIIGRYEHYPINGGQWAKKTKKGMRIQGGISDQHLREFWGRIVLFSLIFIYWYTSFEWLAYFGLMGVTRYSIATGNWTTVGNWSATSGGGSSGDVPGTGDYAIIEGGFTITLTGAQTCGAVKITETGAGTLAGGGFLLTLDDGGVATIFENNGTISGVLDVTILNGNNNRNVDADGTSGNVRNFVINDSGNIYTLSNTMTLDGNLTVTAGTLDTSVTDYAVTAVDITVTGTFTPNSSNIACSGSWDTENGTLTTSTSTITFSGTGEGKDINLKESGGVAVGSLYSIIISGTYTLQTAGVFNDGAWLSSSGTTCDITGTLTIANGVTAVINGSPVLAIDTDTGGGTIDGDGTLVFRGSINEDVSADITTGIECNIQFTNSSDVFTFTGNITTTKDMAIVPYPANTTTLDIDTFTLTCVDITVNSSTTFDMGTGDITCGGDFDSSAGTITGTPTNFTLNGSGDLDIASGSFTCVNMTISAARTFSDPVICTTSFTMTSGSSSWGSNNLTVGGNCNMGGTGTYTPGTHTLTINGTGTWSVNSNSWTVYNVTITNSSAVQLLGDGTNTTLFTQTIGGKLLINTGSTLNLNGNTIANAQIFVKNASIDLWDVQGTVNVHGGGVGSEKVVWETENGSRSVNNVGVNCDFDIKMGTGATANSDITINNSISMATYDLLIWKEYTGSFTFEVDMSTNDITCANLTVERDGASGSTLLDMNGGDIITTANVTVDTGATLDIVVSGSDVNLQCPGTLFNQGTVNIAGDATYDVIIYGDGSNYVTWNNGTPNLSGKIQFGSGTNWGPDFGTNGLNPSFASVTTLTLDDDMRFESFTMTSGTIDATLAGIIIVDVNWNSNGATYTEGSETIQMNGTGSFNATTGSSFNSITIATGITISQSGIAIIVSDTFTTTGTGIWDIASGGRLEISNIANFSNSGTISGASGILEFSGTGSIPASIGTITTGTVEMDGGTITLSGDFTVISSDILVSSGTFDLDGYDVECIDFTISGTLDATTGAGGTVLVNVRGDYDASTGTVTQDTMELWAPATSSGGTWNFGANSNTYYGMAFNKDATFTLDSTNDEIICTNYFDLSVAKVSDVVLSSDTDIVMLDNISFALGSTGSATISGSGSLVFRVTTGGTKTLTPGIYADSPRFNVDIVFENNGGTSPIFVPNAVWAPELSDISLIQTSGTGLEFQLDFDIDCLGFTLGTGCTLDLQSATFTLDGSWNTINGTVTGGASTVSLEGTGSFDVNSTSFSTLNISGSYTNTTGDAIVTAAFDNTGGSIVMANELKITAAPSSVDCGGSITGTGTLVFDSVSGTFSNTFGTISVATTFDDTSSPTYTLGVDLTIGDIMNVSTNAIFQTANNLTNNGGTISGTLQTTGTPTSKSWIFNHDLTIPSGGTFDTSSVATTGFTIDFAEGDTFRVTSGTVKISGSSWTNRVLVDAAFLMNGNGWTLQLENIELDKTVDASVYHIIDIDNTSSNSNYIRSCEIKNSSGSDSRGIDITADITLEIKDCVIDLLGGGNTQKCFITNQALSNVTIDNCFFTGKQYGFQVATATFAGKMRNCAFIADDFSSGALRCTSNGNISSGSVINCTFIARTIGSTVWGDSGSTLELVGCIFDETNSDGAGQIISHLHNRENNKKVFVNSNLTVNASTYTVPHEDTFDWSAEDGKWLINGNNQFESITASNPDVGLKSIFIPCEESSIYWFKFKGTIGATGTLKEVNSYDITKSGTPIATQASFSYDATNQYYWATMNSGSGAVYLQWEIEASAANETFYDIEIREVNSGGNLIWNEDLLNGYTWAGSEQNFNIVSNNNVLAFEAAAVLLTDVVLFGDIDMHGIDITMNWQNLNNSGAEAAFIFARQDASNYYYLKIDEDDTSSPVKKRVQLWEVVSGTPNEIDYAETPANGKSFDFATDPVTIRVRWDANGEFINPTNDGLIEIRINGDVIEKKNGNDGWQKEIVNNYLTDTSLTVGKCGFSGDNCEIDEYILQHHGWFLRDTDMVLSSSVTAITLAADDVWDYERGSVNASRTIFNDVGYDYNEIDVEWLELIFDQLITGTQRWECVENISVGDDIIFATNGKLILIGSIFESSVANQNYTFKTEGSSQEPPMEVSGCLFKDLNPRFRPHDVATHGGAIEVDQGPDENGARMSLIDGMEADKPVEVIRHLPYGRKYPRSVVKGHGPATTTLTFKGYHKICLLGKLRQFQLNEALLEVIWPTGYIWKARIVDINMTRVGRGMNDTIFRVMLEEMR